MNHTFVLNPYFILPFPSSLKSKLKAFSILSFILIFSLLAYYVVQVNLMIKESYLIKKYEIKAERLTQQNKDLDISFAQTTSLENLEKLAQELNFKKTGEIKYIKILESSLVTK